jgi:hypothetical protein
MELWEEQFLLLEKHGQFAMPLSETVRTAIAFHLRPQPG